MDNAPHITIAVITYRRPASLAHTLASLQMLLLPKAVQVSVLVVDNDTQQSAKETVEKARSVGGLDITYATEPQLGIPHARNRALELAQQGHYIAFIDDDDTADKNWLLHLYDAMQVHRADVVQGALQYHFPPGKTHLSRLDIFANHAAQTGATLQTAWTNNVLFATAIYKTSGLCFDPAFASMGGSDIHFFSQIYAQGSRIVMCVEALVHSNVPEERTSLGWLARRHMRVGAGITISQKKHEGLEAALKGACVGIADSVRYAFRLLLGVRRRQDLLHPLMVVCFIVGRFAGLFGVSPREYT